MSENRSVEKTSGSLVDMEQKMAYIENAEIGFLVAFKLPNGKVKSAKIIRKSKSQRMFLLETGYGATFLISYDDVIWVRTGDRWPRGVYELLKGKETEDESED